MARQHKTKARWKAWDGHLATLLTLTAKVVAVSTIVIMIWQQRLLWPLLHPL